MKELAGGIIIATISFFLMMTPHVIRAEEPAEEFLTALRDNGYYDLAIVYLNQMETSDLVSEEFKKSIPFEKAETLIDSATQLRDMDELEARLNEAEQLLTQYSETANSVEAVAKTNRYRGNLRLSRAKLYTRQAESDRLTATEKTVLQNKSREMLHLALEDYSQAREALRKALDEFQVDVANPSTSDELKRLRAAYTQIRLKLPIVKEQLADTYSEQSPDRKKLLTEAAAEYADLYDKYYRFAAGLDSGLFAARCYQKLGQHDDALNMLKELFQLENTSALKILKRNAVALAVDSWKTRQPYPADEVIAQAEPLVNALSFQELRQPDWLKIQLELAVAYHYKAEAAQNEGGSGAAAAAKDLNRKSAKLIRNVSRMPGELRDEATELMKKWNLAVRPTDGDAEEVAPETFLDARQRGQDLVLEVESLMRQIATIKSNIAMAKSQSEKDEFTSELDNAETELDERSQEALQLFELALSLADASAPREDVNKIRYLQSVCYFATQNYFETAIIGEFLLSRYPTVNWTQQAAGLVVRSYSALLDQAPRDNRSFQRAKLCETSEQVISRWPGSKEAGIAAQALTLLAIEDEDYAGAEKYFAMMPSDASVRNALELRLGQRFWFASIKVPSDKTAEETARLAAQAKTYLVESVANADRNDITYDAALASLLLVDAYLESGEVDKAVSQLETEAIAPLDLIKQKHPAVTGTPMEAIFKRETYKSAVKVYLAAMRAAGEQQKWIQKAIGVVAAMRDDPENASQLDSIYRLIAKSLTDQFERLTTPEEKQKFSVSLASFLAAVEKDSKDPKTILWSGKTLLQVANSLSQQSLDAKPIFTQAVSALSRAESLGFANDPDGKRLTEELKWQRALAERGSGKFEEAMDQLGEILKQRAEKQEKPFLEVQVDAAETLYLWGKATQDPARFVEATSGKLPVKDPRTRRESNAIWGLKKLAQVTSSNPRLAEVHTECMYYLIDSRYQYGLIKNNEKAIESARKELENLIARDPSMGGPVWKPRLEELKQQIK
jgi:tetratricopeptide (TPR) repeat protein